MLIGYSMPQAIAIALSGGAGSSWLTADAGAACCDGKPARRARLRWRNDAAPATAHTLSIVLDIVPSPLRIFAMLGLVNMPAGVKVEVYGKRAADPSPTWNFGGGNAATVEQFADGSFGAWFVVPAGGAPVEKVAFRIYNDDGSGTWATASTIVDVGELVAMPAVDQVINEQWAQHLVDPSAINTTRGSQVNSVQVPAYRELTCTFKLSTDAIVRGGGLANGMDWDRLAIALASAKRCVAIPRWKDPTGTPDPVRIHATAMYGVGALAESEHVRGPYWQTTATFREIPAG